MWKPSITPNDVLMHSAKGSTWSKHKYIRKEGKKYIYKETDSKGKSSSSGSDDDPSKRSYDENKKLHKKYTEEAKRLRKLSTSNVDEYGAAYADPERKHAEQIAQAEEYERKAKEIEPHIRSAKDIEKREKREKFADSVKGKVENITVNDIVDLFNKRYDNSLKGRTIALGKDLYNKKKEKDKAKKAEATRNRRKAYAKSAAERAEANRKKVLAEQKKREETTARRKAYAKSAAERAEANRKKYGRV